MPAQDLSSNNDRYKLVFETSSDAIMLLNEKGYFDCNPATLKVFGFTSKEEFCTKGPAELSPPTQPDGTDSTTLANQKIADAYQNGNNSFEWVHKRANGETFPTEVLLTAFNLDGKKVIQAVVRDVTEQKRLELQLAKSHEEEQLILDTIPSWIFYKDDKNRFIRVNKSYADAMNMTKDQLEGKSMYDLFSKEQADKYYADDKEVIMSGQPKRNIIESMPSPKGTLWVQTDKIPLKNDVGKITGIIGFTVDITARKEAEDAAKSHNEELEKMNKLMIGREIKMVELKNKITELENRLNSQ